VKRVFSRWTQCGLVWLAVSVLLVGCGTLPVITPQPDVNLMVSGNVAESGTWDADRLQSLGLIDLVTFQPNGEEVICKGVLLKDLLDAVEPAPDASRVIFIDSAANRVEMPLDEAQACPECLVGFIPLGSGLKLAMPGHPARLWVKNLVSIEIQ
jgi:DMSO/TMAO reductase YedYZ molybdopterin-dependent catalytic subunit